MSDLPHDLAAPAVPAPSKPCPWGCGNPRMREGERFLPTCSACTEASARVTSAEPDSRGIPNIRRGWSPTPESERVRKQWMVRIRPEIRERVRRAAARERLTVADFVERWALSLPET